MAMGPSEVCCWVLPVCILEATCTSLQHLLHLLYVFGAVHGTLAVHKKLHLTRNSYNKIDWGIISSFAT